MKTEANNGISVGDKVRFLAGPRSTSHTTGTVKKIETTGEGRGRATWLIVACDDNRDRKVRPGAATKL